MGLREDLVSKGCIKKTTAGRWQTTYFEDGDMIVVAKICRKCSELLLLNEFNKHKKGLGGRESECKACKGKRDKKYHQENREEILDRGREYRKSHKDEVRARKRRYYSNNRDKVVEYQREYRRLNPDKFFKYYESNRYKLSDYNITYRTENAQRIAESKRRWSEKNREKERLRLCRRRARKKLLPDNLSLEQKSTIFEQFKFGCALTGDKENIQLDHVIPLAIGHGGTTLENIIPLRGDLNNSKNDTNIFEWFNSNYERFNLSREKFDALINYLSKINKMTLEEYREYVYSCHENPRDISTSKGKELKAND
ncbi:HNH endonuclease signature motif containing protein [Priestia megaterium]|uniref:HNH endonuclease signature motif containing protein n=1 Tax=Priestia megaterium TaxID=1404 RepID=UPI0036703343